MIRVMLGVMLMCMCLGVQCVVAEEVVYSLMFKDYETDEQMFVPGWVADDGVMESIDSDSANIIPKVVYYRGMEQVRISLSDVVEGHVSCNSSSMRTAEIDVQSMFSASVPVASSNPFQALSVLNSGRYDKIALESFVLDHIMAVYEGVFSEEKRGIYIHFDPERAAAIAVADMDEDGAWEVLFEVDIHAEEVIYPTYEYTEKHYVLVEIGESYRVVHDTLTTYYNTCDHVMSESGSVTLGMADFDADGELEIGFGSYCYEGEREYFIYEYTDKELKEVFAAPLYGGC